MWWTSLPWLCQLSLVPDAESLQYCRCSTVQVIIYRLKHLTATSQTALDSKDLEVYFALFSKWAHGKLLPASAPPDYTWHIQSYAEEHYSLLQGYKHIYR